MTEPLLGTMETKLGRTAVAHRLALAVVPVDAVTHHPAPPGLRVGRETQRSSASYRARRPSLELQHGAIPVPGAAAYVLLHDRTIPPQPPQPPTDPPPVPPPTVSLRITDRACRFVPRRFSVPIWTLGEVCGADAETPIGTFVPALSRSIRPWLLPGAAYGVPGGATGARMRIVRDGHPVRWARVELFGAAGGRLGWGHGDDNGEVLVLLNRLGNGIVSGPVDVAIRVHIPPSRDKPPENETTDPLWDLEPERLPRGALSPAVPDDVTIGVAVPNGYLTSAADEVRAIIPGRITVLADITYIPM